MDCSFLRTLIISYHPTTEIYNCKIFLSKNFLVQTVSLSALDCQNNDLILNLYGILPTNYHFLFEIQKLIYNNEGFVVEKHELKMKKKKTLYRRLKSFLQIFEYQKLN